MIFGYGNYRHADNEVSLDGIARRNDLAPGGFAVGFTETWNLSGFLQAADVAALTVAINALKAAYSTDGGDAVLYLSDGVTPTSHVLLNSTSKSGVRVVQPPSFQGGAGEYVTWRRYSITLEADYYYSNLQDGLLWFEERIRFSGGGPRFVFRQPLVGLPIAQLVAQATPYRATQSGRAVGKLSYPVPPGPVWPDAEHTDQRDIEEKDPKRSGLYGAPFLSQYEISWKYEFEAAVPLLANPNRWPV